MPNPATVDDIEDRWRPLTAQETTNASALLADAWALLIARRPTLEADMTANTVSEENVIRVVVAMVLRVLRNPEGKLEERIDDYSYRRDSATSTGGLYVTSDELADLSPGRRRQRSVRLVAYGDD